ncbi:MAG: serine hydrolase domain-containing protein [Henriciella sp.]
MSNLIATRTNEAAAAHKVPFVSYGVTRAAGEVMTGHFGHTGHEAVGGDNIFRIASMTKPIVTMAALQLVEAGKLDLHAPAKNILPMLGEVDVLVGEAAADMKTVGLARDITLHHLLTHTSGYAYDFHSDKIMAQVQAGKVPPLAVDNNDFLRAPLIFQPGDNWEYGIGVDFVGQMIEAVSGQDLETYLREMIFEPLGMTCTSFRASVVGADKIVPLGARSADGTITDLTAMMPLIDSPPYSGGGGLYSNVTDYMKFMRVLLNGGQGPNGRILGTDGVHMMQTNQIGDLLVPLQPTMNEMLCSEHEWFPGVINRWSYGLLINESDVPGRRKAGSCAWSGLNCTYFFVDPKSDIGGVVMMQMLPVYNPASLSVFEAFEKAIYETDL